MNGIFSQAPCQSSIRLLIGTHILLLVQAALVFWARPGDGQVRGLVILAFIVGMSGFICAVRGESRAPRLSWRDRRRGR